MAGNDREPPPPDADLDELRKLIVGPEGTAAERVRDVEKRLDDPRLRAEDISRILPQAISLRTKRDNALGHVLEEPVAGAIEKSVKKDPQPIVDAIFPVIGPAIRKAIAHALRTMVQQFNQALEHSFSPRSLLWRLEARRTGRSFAEVVLLKSLVYRVEQVFLIHGKTGLLLRHVQADEVIVKDADMVSAMLTAIRDFVQDSFDESGAKGVQTLQVGEFSIWIEQGPDAVLAAAIRGTAPESLRGRLEETLERVQADFGADLASFEGDATTFESADPLLEACLAQDVRKKKSEVIPVLTFLGALALVLFLGYLFFEAKVRESRWEAYIARLDAEPGLVVASHGEEDGRYRIVGLRDPLARDPLVLLEHFEPKDVSGRWEPYRSLEPSFVLERARRRLAPPESVALGLEGTVLALRGEAPHAWILAARAAAPHLDAIDRIDETGLVDAEARDFDALKRDIEGEDVTAVTATAVGTRLGRLRELAAALGRTYRVEVAGPEAAAVAARLRAHGAAVAGETPPGGGTRVRIVVPG